MAHPTFVRLRLLWGAFDFTADPEAPTYTAANSHDGLAQQFSVRRSVLQWTRPSILEDVVQTHFDWVNYTDGQPDDTWTGADFDIAETNLQVFWGNIKEHFPEELVLSQIRWYRKGPGATPPEPAVRVLELSVPGTSNGPLLPQQVACTLSMRTGLRKRWGRSYLPAMTTPQLGTAGHWDQPVVDDIGQNLSTLIGNMAGSDFMAAVYSPTMQRAYAVEHIQVDSIPDIIRRRRSKGT